MNINKLDKMYSQIDTYYIEDLNNNRIKEHQKQINLIKFFIKLKKYIKNSKVEGFSDRMMEDAMLLSIKDIKHYLDQQNVREDVEEKEYYENVLKVRNLIQKYKG